MKRFLNSIPFFELKFTKNSLKIFPWDFKLFKSIHYYSGMNFDFFPNSKKKVKLLKVKLKFYIF